LPPLDIAFLQQWSLRVRFAVASKEAGLGLEKNVQLLTLVSVSASVELPKFCGRSVDALVPRSGQ